MNKLIVSAVAVAALAAGGALFVYGGFYDISATDQHLSPTYRLLDTAMRRSVLRRAEDIAVPPLDDERLVLRGLAQFNAHCIECHGAPGVAPEPFALGMTPVPVSLVHTAQHWKPAELFWVIREGIKMTGMPAWEFRLSDQDIWAIVAFIERLPSLTPARYQALQVPELAEAAPGAGRRDATPADDERPDVRRGRRAIEQHACVTCHRIPGIVGPNSPVGPPLERIGTRAVLAGLLPNTPENMVRWLMEPQRVHPGSAMPDLGVQEREARDMAAYLYTLR